MASRKICKTDRYKGDFRKIKEKEPQKIETKGKTSWSIVWKHSKAAIGRVWSFLKILPQAILLIPKGILYVLYLFFMGNFPSEKDTTPLTAKIFIRRFFIVIDNIIAPVLFFYFTFRVYCIVENIAPSFSALWNDYCLGPTYGGLILFGFCFVLFFRKLCYSDRPCWVNFRNKKILKYWLYGNIAFPLLFFVVYLLRVKLLCFLLCLYHGVPQEVIGPRRYFALMLCTMLFFNVAAFRNLLHDFKKLGLMNDKSGRK